MKTFLIKEKTMTKEIKVDYLFLDNQKCTRCKKTEDVLDKSFSELEKILSKAGYEFTLRKEHITNKEKAIEFQFVSSPTIRINGKDIALNLTENSCDDCGDLCGCGEDTQCRTWEFEGKTYEVPPVSLVLDRMLSTIYSTENGYENSSYNLPENLVKYFKGIDTKLVNLEEESCCSSDCCS